MTASASDSNRNRALGQGCGDFKRSATNRYFPLMRSLLLTLLALGSAYGIAPANAQTNSYWQEMADGIKIGMTRTEVEKVLPLKAIILTSITGGWDSVSYTYKLDSRWALQVVYHSSGKIQKGATTNPEVDIVKAKPKLYESASSKQKLDVHNRSHFEIESKKPNGPVHLTPTRRHAGCFVASLPASVAPPVRGR